MNVTLTPYAPSVFTYQRSSGVFDPIIVHSADNQLVTPTDPAVPGEYLVVYGTGIGDLTVAVATDAFSPTSPVAAAKVTPTATIGGANALVGFAGLTPGGIGLAQFNIQVPNNLSSGSTFPLVINFNGATSAPVNIAVRSAAVISAFTITTVAGTGNPGYAGDGGAATASQVNHPQGVVADALGNLFIADSQNARIREIKPDGTISTVAGTGQFGFSGDGGSALNAQLDASGVAVDAAGNLYIADGNNGRVRKVSANGTITTVAGTGQLTYSGDGGPAIAAGIGSVSSIAVDSTGNLYIAAPLSARIRKVSVDGTITTVAGNGLSGYSGDGGLATNASLNNPFGVGLDSAGNIYIADSTNGRIRKVTPNGTITTVAGGQSFGNLGDGGPATSANLAFPEGMAVDVFGNLYIADTDNHRIRLVGIDGTIKTVAGTGNSAFSGDDGPATKADLNFPNGVAVDTAGNVYVADSVNNRIRKLTPVSSGTGQN
jgi:sugar lactone lactonase YvrE